jgi:hypothetical protein
MILTEYAPFCTEDLCDYALSRPDATTMELELAQRLTILMSMREEEMLHGNDARRQGKVCH